MQPTKEIDQSNGQTQFSKELFLRKIWKCQSKVQSKTLNLLLY